MDISEKIFDYLKLKLETFEKTRKKGAFLFTCPNINSHKFKSKAPTATFIQGSDKISCLICGWKGTFFDVIRLLEPEKKGDSDAQITEYLINSFKLDMYEELDEYKKYGWSLVPIAKHSKAPIEKDWTSVTHYEKVDWIKWLNNGLNIGVRTGEISKITVIDVDLKDAPAEGLEPIFKSLKESKTLVQNTPHGLHFVFQYDKEIPQTVNIAGLSIDVRNDGGQIVSAPSKIHVNSYSWVNLGAEIKIIPEEIKAKLLGLLKVDKGRNEKMEEIKVPENNKPLVLKNENLAGCCNNTFIQLGGMLIKKLTTDNTKYVLHLFNKYLLKDPMPSKSIEAMIGSLDNYKETEESTQEKTIYECCKLLKMDIHAKDITEHTALKRNIVDKYLSKLQKEGKIFRTGRGTYDFKDKLEWGHMANADLDLYPYKIPYFDDIAYFQQGDIILLGGLTGKGKTHQALNIVKQMVVQGIKPYYISFESGSRYKKIAKGLKLKDTDFYVPTDDITNPLHISLEDKAFTIIDWLYLGDDFAATPKIFNHLKNEMRKSNGILVVFTQLKEDYTWFAKNLIKDFVALSARYIHDDNTGVIGHWEVDKIREPKGQYLNYTIPCEYNFDTKEFTKKDII